MPGNQGSELINERKVPDPFVRPAVTKDAIYWRLHGNGSAYNAYTDAELEQLLEWTGRQQAPEYCYVMFNEIPRVADSKKFMALLE